MLRQRRVRTTLAGAGIVAILGLGAYSAHDGDAANGGPWAEVGPNGPSQAAKDYAACAMAAGIDPGFVNPVGWPDDSPVTYGEPKPDPGDPWIVGTAKDVPAHVHRPCAMKVGAPDPHASSHGEFDPSPPSPPSAR